MQAVCATEANLSQIHWKTGQNGKEKGYFRRSSCDHRGYEPVSICVSKKEESDTDEEE